MRRFLATVCLVLLATTVGLVFILRQQDAVEADLPPIPEPVTPAGYKKIAPSSSDGSKNILSQTATVFRGALKSVRFTYDPCAGPRTNYVFSDVSVLLGEPLSSEVVVKVFGGPAPGGTWLRTSDHPPLALDTQYIVFMRNTDWTYSPVVGGLALRQETVGGRELLIDAMGYALTGWDENGPKLSASLVSEPVGRKRRGYRNAEPVAQSPGSPSAEADPAATIAPSKRGSVAPSTQPTESSSLASAPSNEQMRLSGLFAKPPVVISASGDEKFVSAESLVGLLRAEADRQRIKVGGRIALEPYWKCWSSTPTVKAAERRLRF